MASLSVCIFVAAFSLFHRQNIVFPKEHAKEIKYTDARS